MRAVVQRVVRASFEVAGETRGEIGRGLVVLVACQKRDTDADVAWTAQKIAHLRVFEDDAGKLNRSVRDGAADAHDSLSVLLIPNFTVAACARHGRRPSFDDAMPPEIASTLFDRLAEGVHSLGIPVVRGIFQADMAVTLTNDGPVTIILESPMSRVSE
jgi:D-tyrosyl-tRNA(Tyr) deacylase